MKYINKNRVYRCSNKDLKIKSFGSHDVIVIWNNPKINLCRIKTITSLEHERKDHSLKYDFNALGDAKKGVITPYSLKEIKTKHWSGINNKSILININKLYKSHSGAIVPKKNK
ncbi:MAG: hypothetical protein WCR97_03965 [Bacilli bacterium]